VWWYNRYRHALRLYDGSVKPHERTQAVREMLTAAVTDTSCLLEYYGAEHFMSQMQLAAQGTPLDVPTKETVTQPWLIEPHTLCFQHAPRCFIVCSPLITHHSLLTTHYSPPLLLRTTHYSPPLLLRRPYLRQVAFFKLEQIGHRAEELAHSPFLAAIGAGPEHLNRSQLEACVAEAEAAAFNTADAGGRVASEGFANLPDEEEVFNTLRAEPALLVSLCHVYAQDTACLAAQYEPPPVCRSLLEW
jgi:hypothetical protein